MSATDADTCINVLRNIRGLQSGNMSESNMGGTQVTSILKDLMEANFEQAVGPHLHKIIFIAKCILYITLTRYCIFCNFCPIVLSSLNVF